MGVASSVPTKSHTARSLPSNDHHHHHQFFTAPLTGLRQRERENVAPLLMHKTNTVSERVCIYCTADGLAGRLSYDKSRTYLLDNLSLRTNHQ